MTTRRDPGQFAADCWAMAALCIDLADFAPEAVRLAGMTSEVDGFGSGSAMSGPSHRSA